MVVQLYKFTKNYRIAYFQGMIVMDCKLYLNKAVKSSNTNSALQVVKCDFKNIIYANYGDNLINYAPPVYTVLNVTYILLKKCQQIIGVLEISYVEKRQ